MARDGRRIVHGGSRGRGLRPGHPPHADSSGDVREQPRDVLSCRISPGLALRARVQSSRPGPFRLGARVRSQPFGLSPRPAAARIILWQPAAAPGQQHHRAAATGPWSGQLAATGFRQRTAAAKLIVRERPEWRGLPAQRAQMAGRGQPERRGQMERKRIRPGQPAGVLSRQLPEPGPRSGQLAAR